MRNKGPFWHIHHDVLIGYSDDNCPFWRGTIFRYWDSDNARYWFKPQRKSK